MSAQLTRTANPELFQQLRLDALLSAFRSLDERRQRKVVTFANTLALERTRERAWRAAKRGKGVPNRILTTWIGGGR